MEVETVTVGKFIWYTRIVQAHGKLALRLGNFDTKTMNAIERRAYILTTKHLFVINRFSGRYDDCTAMSLPLSAE